MVPSPEKLYLFEDNKLFEVTGKHELLDTNSTCEFQRVGFQGFVNKEGIIFLLDGHGKVLRIDPFGEKQLTEPHNLERT